MTVSPETKCRWFDQGVAALAQRFPDGIAGLDPDLQARYACPQCAEFDEAEGRYTIRLFPRAAIESGDLTAEHVPARAFGGKELLLTCASCNHTAGSRIESHARKSENLTQVLEGRANKETRVNLKMGGYRVSANLQAEGRKLFVRLPAPEKHANDPRVVDGLSDSLRSGAFQEQVFGIEGEGYKAQPARVAWLRAAYLAMFALNGYQYIFSPGLEIVRKQIQEPEAEHIPRFLFVIPGDRPWTDRRIMKVHEPEWQRSWAVQIGRNVVFLPRAGDATLYERLGDVTRNSHEQAKIICSESCEWPIWPNFGLRPGSEG